MNFSAALKKLAALQEPIDEEDDAPAPYGATHGTDDPDTLATKLEESEENAIPGDSSEQPDTCSWCGGGEFIDFQDTGRGTRARCAQCGGTMVKNPEGIQWQPEFPNSSQNAPSRAGDPRATINDPRAVHATRHVARSESQAQFSWEQGYTHGHQYAAAPQARDLNTEAMNRALQHNAHNPGYGSDYLDGFYEGVQHYREQQGQPTWQSSHVGSLNAPASAEAGYLVFDSGLQSLASLDALAALREPEALWHFTAAWRDVVAKANRIRKEGGVRVLAADQTGAVGEVRGDTATYESVINYVPGSKKVAAWSCGCKWAAYAWGRSPKYKRFEGRQCSHVAALRFEVQARGMFGRDVTPDIDRMESQYQRSPVQVQYQRPTSRAPEKPLRRRTVPPGNMRRTFSAMDQELCPHDQGFNLHGQCRRCGYTPPTEDDEPCDEPWCVAPPSHEWARIMTATGRAPAEVLTMLRQLGMSHQAARQALDYATAGPMSNVAALAHSEDGPIVVVAVLEDRVVAATGREYPIEWLRFAKKDDEEDEPEGEATADPMGGQAEPGTDIPRLDLRDQSDAKQDKRHILHHTNDSRMHAPEYGYGLPYGGTYVWCDQCNGSGCGHCGGTGQVQADSPPTEAQSGAPGDASTTNSPVADQSADAGDLISNDGLTATSMRHEAIEKFEVPEHRVQEYDRSGRRMFDSPLSRSFESRETAERYLDWLRRAHEENWGEPLPEGKWRIHSPAPTVIEHEPRGFELPGRTIDASLHTADYTATDFLTGPPAQNYQAPTPHSNSQNPSSTGWATSADPPNWEQPIIGQGWGISWEASLKHPEEVAWTDSLPARSSRKEGDPSLPEAEAPTVSGVCVKAADTGRILMIQRSNKDEKDPARGTWEMPGGHHEDGDLTSLHAGIREWQEEVGQPFPEGGHVAYTWRSGPYQGHVVVIPSESDIDFSGGRCQANPDDPDGDDHEQAAWWEVEHAKKNPALRAELKQANPWSGIEKAATKWTITDQSGGGGDQLPERPHFIEPNGVDHCLGCGRDSREHELGGSDGLCADCWTALQSGAGGWGHTNQTGRMGEWAYPPPGGRSVALSGPGEDRVDPHEYFPMHEWHTTSSHRYLTVDEARAAGQQAMAEAGFTDARAYLNHIYAQQEPDLAYIFLGTLHDEPEPALPSTDGAADDNDPVTDASGVRGNADPTTYEQAEPVQPQQGTTVWPDVNPAALRTDRQTAWGYPEAGDTVTDEATVDPDFSPGSADHDMITDDNIQNMPFRTDAALAAAADPVLAEFWKSAGAKALAGNGPSRPSSGRQQAMAAASGRRPGGDASDSDIAAAARAALSKMAAKDFSFAEQQELINEGLSTRARARNLAALQIAGTHYEHITDEDDDGFPF